MQLPIGEGEHFEGIVDLITMKAMHFDGEHGENVVESDIPEDMAELAATKRGEMLESLAMYSDCLLNTSTRPHARQKSRRTSSD